MKIRLAFVVLVFAVAAHGAPPDMAVSLPSTPTISSAQDCPRDGSDSSMTCVLAAVGATTAENRARDRQDLVRLLDWDAWGRLLLVIDFTRDRLGEKRLHIADVYGDGHDIVLPVDAMTWHAAVAAAQRYRDEAAHPPHRVPSPENGIQRVCVTADGMTEIAETVLRGHVLRMRGGDHTTSDGCFDPMDGMALTLRTLAVQAVPLCAKLDLSGAIRQIQRCMALSGDKMVAADVSNRLEPFLGQACYRADQTATFAPLFAPDATMAIDGRPPVSGSSVVKAWAGFVCERQDHFSLSGIDAAADEATVHGSVMTTRIDNTAAGRRGIFHAFADYSQHWTRGPDGQFRLAAWIVGAFSPETEEKSE